MTAQITLSAKHTAEVETRHYGEDRPVIVVFEDGRRTPGQWFATTIIERGPLAGKLFIDAGANWALDTNEAALLFGFAVGVEAARKAAPPAPKHTVRGETSENGWPYGTTHDFDCPACVASGSSYTSSPRSETYWAS